jgi:hypothetical protein
MLSVQVVPFKQVKPDVFWENVHKGPLLSYKTTYPEVNNTTATTNAANVTIIEIQRTELPESDMVSDTCQTCQLCISASDAELITACVSIVPNEDEALPVSAAGIFNISFFVFLDSTIIVQIASNI